MSKARKKPKPYLDTEDPNAGTEDTEKEDENDDIYDEKEREQMLDDDEISAAEEGFMKGFEQGPPSKKQTRKNAISHDDTVSDELAKEDAEED